MKKTIYEKRNSMEKKSVFWWIIFILLCIWQLPQALVGLVMWIFLGKKEMVADRHFNFCWKADKMSGGISLGPIAYVSNRSGKETIAHETDGHTVQSKILGPLYLFIIGFESLLWATFYDNKKHCYYDFYTEKNANFFAKLGVDEKCRLYFK